MRLTITVIRVTQMKNSLILEILNTFGTFVMRTITLYAGPLAKVPINLSKTKIHHLWKIIFMITSFKNKALEELFTKSKTSKLPQDRLRKIKMILATLDAAHDLKDFNVPAFRLHKLKKPPLNGFWSIDVTGNYRIVFWFENGNVSEVDYLDTH